MHKDVKRSLVAWPLVVSMLAVALCWLAVQRDPVARDLVARTGHLWESVAGYNAQAAPPIRPPVLAATVRLTDAHYRSLPDSRRDSNKTGLFDSPEIQRPTVASIPAPILDRHSDLFGFSDRNLNPSQTKINVFGSYEAKTGFSEHAIAAIQPARDEVVIHLDSGVFFADGSPGTTGRSASDVVLPSAYQAPAASVADLSPEIEQSANRPKSTATRNLASARTATWPIAKRLIEQLDALETIVGEPGMYNFQREQPISTDQLRDWSSNVRDILGQLNQSNRLGDPQVGRLLTDLRQAGEFASENAESLDSRSQRVAWLMAAYSIERRLAVWQPIYNVNSGEFPKSLHDDGHAAKVSASISQLQHRLRETGDENGWSSFLILGQLRDAFESGDDLDRREVAQTFLSRIHWPNLAPIHREWIASDSVQELAMAIRPWATGAVDYSALMHQIERAESNSIDLVTAEIAQSMQALRFANHPRAVGLAQNLDTHYRNANLRFSISDQLLQHLMPKLPSQDVPLRTTLLGSRVTGISHVESNLQIKLIPSPSTWELSLEAIGNVSTRSVGRRGPAAVSTSSVNPFSASTPITIHPTDIQLGTASVDVGGQARLRGIKTTYDSWPLIGSLVQNIAQNEYFKKASLANRIGRSRIRTQVGEEIGRTIGEKVATASSQFSTTVLGPLNNLKLDPQVIDMESTSSRLIARYRMAGDLQLAAMTPRPRALSDNLFSVQMHQSAINNTLEKLVPQDGVQPIGQVLQQCFDLLGASSLELPEDLPDDTSIQFAKHRPITIEIEDGTVWITMRIIRLERGKRMRLRNFIVRAAYKPQIDGLNASLVRDKYLSISGPRMSMGQRISVRTVFNKVLSPNRPLPLLSAELLQQRLPTGSQITQLELRDGWIGISIGALAEHQTVASRPRGIR